MEERRKGIVLFFDDNRGRGKILGNDGEIYKVTYKNIRGSGFRILWELQRVNFRASGNTALDVSIEENNGYFLR
jgi:cold shock CspA family protein